MIIQIGDIKMEKVTEQSIVLQADTTAQDVAPSKTTKYLLPCLSSYGTEFNKRLSNVFKVAAGIGDIIVDNVGTKHEKHVFILIDTKIDAPTFREFIQWIRQQPMYENDYVYDNITKTRFHMVIIKLPEKFYGAFTTFKKGEYSKMYSMENIEKFFVRHPETKKVMVKDNSYKITFAKTLNKLWNTTISEKEAHEIEGELDLPPTDESEVFNHHIKRKKHG